MLQMLIMASVLLLALVGLRAFALSANRSVTSVVDPDTKVYPVAAAVRIYTGAFVGIDPAGYLKPFEPGDMFVGVSYEEADNTSGAAGALTCRVQVGVEIVHALTGVGYADVGKPAYATDDGTLALTGHFDAYVGTVTAKEDTSVARIQLKRPGEKPRNGAGSIELLLTGHEAFAATGATAGTSSVNGFDLKSILGTGWVMNDAEDGGIKGDFDNTAEVALCSARTRNDCLPVDKGVTFEVDLVVADKADAAAVDIDFGLGSALTTNSEADIDHADMAQLAAFHMDGNSDNILAQSDDATTDVAAVDTTIDNDSTTDVAKKFKIVVRPDGEVQFWVNGARVLPSTSFGLLSTALVGAFVNMEKTSDDTTASIIFRNLRVAGGMAA